jgi:hypothetical protein
VIIIPTRTDLARYSMRVELRKVKYLLDFDWNDRDQSWYLSVSTDAEVPLLTGIKIVVGFPLINRFRDERLPVGDLSAIDTSGKGIDPAFADLGGRVLLTFTPIEEFPESLVVRA